MRPKYAGPLRNPVSDSRPFMNRVLAEERTRRLTVDSGGRYKFYILSKIVNFLKTEFLEAREKRLPLKQLLDEVNETNISEEIVEWLKKDALPNDRRIRVLCEDCEEARYAYQPPITCKTAKDLLSILKRKHDAGEGFIFRQVVEDSMPLADRSISGLLQANQIGEFTRLDKVEVIFFRKPEPDLDNCLMDERFKDLYRRVGVYNKEMDHIKKHLRNQRIKTFEIETYNSDTMNKNVQQVPEPAPAPVPKRKRRKVAIRHNTHVQADLVDHAIE